MYIIWSFLNYIMSTSTSSERDIKPASTSGVITLPYRPYIALLTTLVSYEGRAYLDKPTFTPTIWIGSRTLLSLHFSRSPCLLHGLYHWCRTEIGILAAAKEHQDRIHTSHNQSNETIYPPIRIDTNPTTSRIRLRAHLSEESIPTWEARVTEFIARWRAPTFACPQKFTQQELLNLGIHFQPWQLELFKQISTWSGLNPYKYK